MMKRCFIALALLMFLTPCLAQEVAVFKSHRSMRIVSHSMKNGWTYMKLKDGEMAVRSSTILSIAKETTKAPADVTSSTGRAGAKPHAQPAAGRRPPAGRVPPPPRATLRQRLPASPTATGRGIRGRFNAERGSRPTRQGNSPGPVRSPRKKH